MSNINDATKLVIALTNLIKAIMKLLKVFF
uniref:Uncharacterized protein n=1 Tax=Siphoviridae sp. ctHjK2 TaxID=2827831 RepID=A0A8S5SQT6_9CAUD|nr:MAG TPA: hypothetical protein [Siphoviridae sp. ctHjK2]